MSILIDANCGECDIGKMEISDPPVLGDYNAQGNIDPFCDTCGSSFENEILEFDKIVQTTFVNSLSNKKLKELVTVIYVRNGLRFLKYPEMQAEIQDIRSNCNSKRDLINYLLKKYSETEEFLERRL